LLGYFSLPRADPFGRKRFQQPHLIQPGADQRFLFTQGPAAIRWHIRAPKANLSTSFQGSWLRSATRLLKLLTVWQRCNPGFRGLAGTDGSRLGFLKCQSNGALPAPPGSVLIAAATEFTVIAGGMAIGGRAREPLAKTLIAHNLSLLIAMRPCAWLQRLAWAQVPFLVSAGCEGLGVGTGSGNRLQQRHGLLALHPAAHRKGINRGTSTLS